MRNVPTLARKRSSSLTTIPIFENCLRSFSKTQTIKGGTFQRNVNPSLPADIWGTRRGRSSRIEMDRMGQGIKSVIVVLELVSVMVITYALAALTLLMVD